jgi:hypothetical protein
VCGRTRRLTSDRGETYRPDSRKEIAVAPHRIWVSVIACGPDRQVAEYERNSLRQKIIDLRLN